MGSDDFIKLNSPSHLEHQVEDNDTHKLQAEENCLSTAKTMVSTVNHIEAENFADGSNIEAHNENAEEEDGQPVQDMDLEEDDLMPKLPIPQGNAHLVDSLSTLKRVDIFETKLSTNIISSNSNSNVIISELVVDETPITSAKRARTASSDQQPSVNVVYSCLTRESKKLLMELMQQWSQWQAKHQASTNVSGNAVLESGEDIYFAALHVGSDKTNAVSFWLDNQSKKEDIGDFVKFDGDTVPLYDRGFTVGLSTLDGPNNSESRTQASEASRCFNCSSYSHALKDCPKPRDNVAISSARKQHNSSKSNQNASSRNQTRYYQKSSGKFDDLKAGVLGSEARECLGIGELDPPPWLNRMRELGYPPGYLDDEEEDQPSGITIFADEEEEIEREEGELPERLDPAPSKRRRKTVEFPGINAPIPEKADAWLWGASSSLYNHFFHSSYGRPSDSHRGRHNDPCAFADRQDSAQPSSAHLLSGFSRPGDSIRHSSQNHNFTIRTPNLGRSLSDRSWQSPVHYENSPIYSPHSPNPVYSPHSPHPVYSPHSPHPVYSPQTPHPIPSPAWQAPQYHSPAGSIDHQSQESSFHLTSDSRERDHRSDHHRLHHRR
ncbi:hypothetical protein KSP39_PZI013612 [Platanthera zijinensis]|uniref:CCHC-type domain-containing protein n=1 Tax=Platanthera zijinensis TaxID=2320716 RepID=A0AAP0G484_9ASPA